MPGEATAQDWQDKHTMEDESLQEFHQQQEAARIITNYDDQKPKLLHTCGVSLVTIVQSAHLRLERFPGPIGTLTRKLSPIATPIVQPVHHAVLSLLSFADVSILPKISTTVVSAFPPSAYLLEKLGHRAEQIAESLPEKFNRAMDRLPSIARSVPIFGWIFCLTMSVLTTEWSKMDDLGPEEVGVEAEVTEKVVVEDNGDGEEESNSRGGSEKEEGGKGGEKEKEEIEEEKEKEGKGGEKEKEEIEEEKEKVAVADEIPILELFEEGWHTIKRKGGKKLNESKC